MENHGGHGNRENYGPRNRDSHGYGNRDLGMMGGPAPYDPHPRTARRPSMALLLFGLVLWSLLAWVGYALVDPALGWAATSSGALVDGGKGLATAVGAGKEVGAVVDKLNVSGAVGQTIAFLRVVLKPAIIVVWAIGALALLAAPMILPWVGSLLGGRRH